MSHSRPPHHSEPEIERLMASAAGAAFVVGPRAARLHLANAAGRAWLGLPPRAALADPETPATEPAALDPAMPAVARLGELADSLGPDTRCSVKLTFWTPHGDRTAVCDVAFVGGGAETLAMVEPGPDDQPAQAREAPQPTPDDVAILKEIARRIRSGQSLRAAGRADPGGGGDALLSETPGQPPPAPAAEPQGVRIAKLAHELKTPLSAIAAAAEIMRDERFGPIGNARYQSYASDIFDSARHALMVIGNMLGDAAAGTEFDQAPGQPAMVFTEVDLNAMAESCVSSMRPLADAAGLSLSATLAEGLPHVVADATALRQIALNLLTNAVKFSARGGVIGLETRHDHDRAGRVDLVVRDTGRGMTAGEIADAHASGEQAALTPRAGGGLGIGLPLVAALARANGAELAIASEPARGTTVTVSFAKDRVVPV